MPSAHAWGAPGAKGLILLVQDKKAGGEVRYFAGPVATSACRPGAAPSRMPYRVWRPSIDPPDARKPCAPVAPARQPIQKQKSPRREKIPPGRAAERRVPAVNFVRPGRGFFASRPSSVVARPRIGVTKVRIAASGVISRCFCASADSIHSPRHGDDNGSLLSYAPRKLPSPA